MSVGGLQKREGRVSQTFHTNDRSQTERGGGLYLEITVAHTTGMAIQSTFHKLLEIKTGCLFVEASFVDNFIKQFTPFDQFKDNEDFSARRQHFDQFDNVGVVNQFHD